MQLLGVQGAVLAAGGHSPGPGLGEPWPPEARMCGYGSDGHVVTSLPWLVVVQVVSLAMVPVLGLLVVPARATCVCVGLCAGSAP